MKLVNQHLTMIIVILKMWLICQKQQTKPHFVIETCMLGFTETPLHSILNTCEVFTSVTKFKNS